MEDQITAHLDRGWDLLEKVDLDGAEVSAKAILALVPDSPDALTLVGAIAAARGDEAAALSAWRKAAELDPDYVDPLLHAAELHLDRGEDGDLAKAAQLCERALELAEEEEDYLDALLLRAEIHLAADEPDEAEQKMLELPPGEILDASGGAACRMRAGRILLELGDLDEAEAHFRAALALDAGLSDAHHALGLIHEERGEPVKMVEEWRRVREADLKDPAPPWGVPRERFEALAEEALAELPEPMRKLLENVPILCSDYPSAELTAEGSDPRMMGFFAGVPYPEQSTAAGEAPHLECVYLYQRNIERWAQSTEEVEEEIRTTLFHEAGHFLGLSEEELERLGLA